MMCHVDRMLEGRIHLPRMTVMVIVGCCVECDKKVLMTEVGFDFGL